MADPELKYWQSKSRIFHLVWFSFLNGLLLLELAFNGAPSLVDQTAANLSDFGSESIIPQSARMALQVIVPLQQGWSLAFWSPLLSITAFYMLGRSKLPSITQQHILLRTHIRFMLSVTPVALPLCLTAALFSAYIASPERVRNFHESLYPANYVQCTISATSFAMALCVLAYLEIKALYKSTNLPMRIAVCVLFSIVVNPIAVIAVDSGIRHLVGQH